MIEEAANNVPWLLRFCVVEIQTLATNFFLQRIDFKGCYKHYFIKLHNLTVIYSNTFKFLWTFLTSFISLTWNESMNVSTVQKRKTKAFSRQLKEAKTYNSSTLKALKMSLPVSEGDIEFNSAPAAH